MGLVIRYMWASGKYIEKGIWCMKENVVVVCVGKVFIRNLAAIADSFEIVALADNNKNGQIIEGYKCIAIEDILMCQYDKVIICSVQYALVIREQLLSVGVESARIYDIESIYNLLYYAKDIQKYKSDKCAYREACRKTGMKYFLYDEKNELPMLTDYRDCAGMIERHYFLTDIMMAREVIRRKPQRHYDIGSRIDGFISHLLAVDMDVTIIDVRPLDEINPGGGIRSLKFIQADAVNLEYLQSNSVESLSALHSVEHFGLGRYGDSIDPEAYIKSIRMMKRVLKKGGYLYFAVPVGREEKLCFNAHRIFSPKTILDNFESLTLEKMWLLHDMRFYEYIIEELKAERYKDVIGEYDCGLYIFRK